MTTRHPKTLGSGLRRREWWWSNEDRTLRVVTGNEWVLAVVVVVTVTER